MCLGIPGQIVQITDVARQMALVDVSGVQREVSLECVVDDYFPKGKSPTEPCSVHVEEFALPGKVAPPPVAARC